MWPGSSFSRVRRASLFSLLVLVGCVDVAMEPCDAAEGELLIQQIGLTGPTIGESALVTSPDGTKLLIDVGNGAHEETVRGATGGEVDLLLVTHPDQDHAGGLDGLEDVVGAAESVREPGSWDLGGGAELVVFLVDGVLEVDGEPVDLRDEVPGIDGSDNARSCAGYVRWGDFVYLFAGDLTGGGKGTPDVESAVAARGGQLLSSGDADLVHLSHHGIGSSTNPSWVDWLLPDDGQDRSAVVGANRGYLAAPHDSVVERVAPRLGSGRVHATEVGQLSDPHPSLVEHGGAVHVAVFEDGANYQVCGEAFESTAR